jgi:hypothetical protein
MESRNISKLGEQCEMLKALVIVPTENTKEFGALLAVARAEARRREHSEKNPPILVLRFLPELSIYVAVYEAQETQKPEAKKQSG